MLSFITLRLIFIIQSLKSNKSIEVVIDMNLQVNGFNLFLKVEMLMGQPLFQCWMMHQTFVQLDFFNHFHAKHAHVQDGEIEETLDLV